MSGTTGIKISDAASAAPLVNTDMVPIARVGSDVPYSGTMADVATFVTSLASNIDPQASGDPGHPGVALLYARGDHYHPSDPSRAPLDSPDFTGVPTTPTPLVTDNSLTIANTQWVNEVLAAEPPEAPLDSPNFTGIPTAPQAPIDNDTDQLATCTFVLGQASAVQPPMASGQPTAGVSTRFSRGDHVHPIDTSRAPLVSPAFTGLPTAPTPQPDTNTTVLATTQFVLAQAATVAPLIEGTAAPGSSFRYARADHVHPAAPPFGPAGGYLSGSFPNPQVNRVKGVSDSSSAAAGDVGEVVTSTVLAGGALSLTTGVITNLQSINLTAGDWDISGNFVFTGTSNSIQAWFSVSPSANPGAPNAGGFASVVINNAGGTFCVGPMRQNLGASATIWASVLDSFGGTVTVYGFMMARRAR